MAARSQQFHLIIPTGTKVVSRHDRRVGVVVHSPATLENAYRVRFADGHEASFRRADVTIFRQDQEVIPDQIHDSALYQFVAYRCIVGSTAYGLATETSDLDRRGFYLPPAELEWSLAGVLASSKLKLGGRPREEQFGMDLATGYNEQRKTECGDGAIDNSIGPGEPLPKTDH